MGPFFSKREATTESKEKERVRVENALDLAAKPPPNTVIALQAPQRRPPTRVVFARRQEEEIQSVESVAVAANRALAVAADTAALPNEPAATTETERAPVLRRLLCETELREFPLNVTAWVAVPGRARHDVAASRALTTLVKPRGESATILESEAQVVAAAEENPNRGANGEPLERRPKAEQDNTVTEAEPVPAKLDEIELLMSGDEAERAAVSVAAAGVAPREEVRTREIWDRLSAEAGLHPMDDDDTQEDVASEAVPENLTTLLDAEEGEFGLASPIARTVTDIAPVDGRLDGTAELTSILLKVTALERVPTTCVAVTEVAHLQPPEEGLILELRAECDTHLEN